MTKKRRGFTLLEALVVMMLIAAGLTSVLYIMSRAIFITGVNESEIIAANLAQEKIEELRNTTYASISDETKAAVPGFAAFNRSVSVTTPITGLKEVTVTVYWFAGSSETNLSSASYISDILP